MYAWTWGIAPDLPGLAWPLTSSKMTLVRPFLSVMAQWILSHVRRTCCFVTPLGAALFPFATAAGAAAAFFFALWWRRPLIALTAAVPIRKGTWPSADRHFRLDRFSRKTAQQRRKTSSVHCHT